MERIICKGNTFGTNGFKPFNEGEKKIDTNCWLIPFCLYNIGPQVEVSYYRGILWRPQNLKIGHSFSLWIYK